MSCYRTPIYELSHEALTEVIRQAYVIGVKDGAVSGEQGASAIRQRCISIRNDVTMQMLNGPLTLHKYDTEPTDKRG